MAKRFKEAAAAARPVYSTIIGSVSAPQNTQDTHDVQDAPDTQHAQDTQAPPPGKKAKLPRINMAFSEENLEYLRVMAALKGQSVTRYVNSLVEADRTQKATVYQTAKNLTTRGGQ